MKNLLFKVLSSLLICFLIELDVQTEAGYFHYDHYHHHKYIIPFRPRPKPKPTTKKTTRKMTTGKINYDSTDVVMVQVMFRHGVRSVLQNYPNEPTPLSYWDKYGGTGQLTTVGMRQLYEFGGYFKNMYRGFLNTAYNKSRVQARSTSYDRTMQSVSSFLAGLFQPTKDQIFTPDLPNWLPIPVRTEALNNDMLLHANAPCPRYDQLRVIMRNSSEYLDQQRYYQDFLKKMSDLSGLKPSHLDYYHMWEIADNALVDQAHGIKIPQWVQDSWTNITIANDYTFYIDFVTVEMGKLISGPLLNEIVSNINKKVNGSINQLYVYGVHDNYIAGMQKLLNTSTMFVQPNFASAFVFELRKNQLGEHFVKVLYKNSLYPGPVILKPVTVYGCQELCPLSDFLRIVGDKLVTNITAICNP